MICGCVKRHHNKDGIVKPEDGIVKLEDGIVKPKDGIVKLERISGILLCSGKNNFDIFRGNWP